VDPWFIVDSALEEARPIRLARDINDGQPERVVQQVIAAAAPFERPVIACLGLTYKPDIDDLRESPALEITVRLAGLGLGSILVVEPHLAELPADLIATGVALNLPVGCHQPG
jgi:UDP-N-acetyl-D-mannosaminuronic acid dehydrogenase